MQQDVLQGLGSWKRRTFGEKIPCGFVAVTGLSLLQRIPVDILWTAYQIYNLEGVHGDSILLRSLEDHKFRADFLTNIASACDLSDDESAYVIMVVVHLQSYILPTATVQVVQSCWY